MQKLAANPFRMALSLNKPKLDNLAGDIWKSAERLRGKFKAYEYQNVILPIIVIRRLECVLIDWREKKRAEILAKRPKLGEKELATLPEPRSTALLRRFLVRWRISSTVIAVSSASCFNSPVNWRTLWSSLALRKRGSRGGTLTRANRRFSLLGGADEAAMARFSAAVPAAMPLRCG